MQTRSFLVCPGSGVKQFEEELTDVLGSNQSEVSLRLLLTDAAKPNDSYTLPN